jgi:mono/diheme cytochrome c family protein
MSPAPPLRKAASRPSPSRLPLLRAVSCLALSTAPALSEGPVPADLARGEKIYRETCADCHGRRGEGVKGKYDDPLAGNRSIPSLARLISKTMPEGKEGTCTGKDAEAVSAYIHASFYSPAAQARIRPVEESLSRLTVAQYQNSIADLVGRFRPGFDRTPGAERGLRGFYSGFAIPSPEEIAADAELEKTTKKKKDRNARKKENFDRIDAEVKFHFGGESPNTEKMIPEEFSVRWVGSLLAPETGIYEFTVKTENGFRLFVNEQDTPLIDSWVTPGPEVREERKKMFLLGGRAYRFELSFFKFKDKTASVEVYWKPPHGREELLPRDRLMPQEVRPNMVLNTPLPADDRSDGYERGTTLSKEWDQATTAAAIEVADHVQRSLDNLAGTKAGAPDRLEKLKAFCVRFAETAFRRPLTEDQRAAFINRAFEAAPTPVLAVKRVVLFTLKSPRFLYPELSHGEKPDGFSTASRLALVLWDSLPDAGLWKAAGEGKLATRQDAERETSRMLADPRTRAKLNGFFERWLDLERADHAAKDSALFPGFDENLRTDLRESLALFLDEVVWGQASDYRQLLRAEHLWLNTRLAKYYGAEISSEGFQRVVPAPGQRAGVLTHPYLLSSLAYSRSTSPIHRGVFLTRSIVGMPLKNPSTAVAFEDAKFDPSLTMREKVSSLTKGASCTGCHGVINPLGFTLEHFDAVGRWRTEDNRKPVDSKVEFHTEEGAALNLSGAGDVAELAVKSEMAHEAFVREMFLYAVKQPPAAFGTETLQQLRSQFSNNQFHIRKLFASIALTKAMHGAPGELPTVAGALPQQNP